MSILLFSKTVSNIFTQVVAVLYLLTVILYSVVLFYFHDFQPFNLVLCIDGLLRCTLFFPEQNKCNMMIRWRQVVEV